MSTHTITRHRAGAGHSRRSSSNNNSLTPIRGEVQHLMETVREKVGQIKDKTSHAIEGTEKTVKQHPWTSLGVAVGVGVILGMFLRRR